MDPTFQTPITIDRAGLDDEASGVMLVARDRAPAGWEHLAKEETARIWGKGEIYGQDPGATKPTDLKIGGVVGSENLCRGMAAYRLHALLCSVNIVDTPIGYSPAYGMSMNFTVTYNHREAQQQAIFTHGNFGYKWTHNWHAYVEDDPVSITNNVRIFVRGGGHEIARDFNQANGEYAPQQESRAIVRRVSTNPIKYERAFPDGSREIYEKSDGTSTVNRRVYLTQVVDSFGNMVTLNYVPATVKLSNVTDATGATAFTLSYEHPLDPLVITKVTDRYGRVATFSYVALSSVSATPLKLAKITDPVGIESAFGYSPNADIVNSMTTPDGTTQFLVGVQQSDLHFATPFVEVTLPDGSKERAEFSNHIQYHPAYTSQYAQIDPIVYAEQPIPVGIGVRSPRQTLYYRNTFYWDRKAMAMSPGVLAKAQIFHFLHGDGGSGQGDWQRAVGSLEATKKPYESWVWYNYKNQDNGDSQWPTLMPAGAQQRVTKIGRVLEDGTTQLYEFDYNSLGQQTVSVDPEGRRTLTTYDASGRFPTEVRQQNGPNQDFIERVEYFPSAPFVNTGIPWKKTDASGAVFEYSYNAKGQMTQITGPTLKTYGVYHASGDGKDRLWKVEREGTNPVGARVTLVTYTYDYFGRVATVTNEEGDVTSFLYDFLDRIIGITYPDGTTEQVSYIRPTDNKQTLYPHSMKDRAGRWAFATYNGLGEVIQTQDAMGNIEKFEWCRCGELQKYTDPRSTVANPIVTQWSYDEQGRLLSKTFPSGKQELYGYETGLSRLKYVQDAKGQRTNYTYNKANERKTISYTNASGQPLNPATPGVTMNYDTFYARLTSVTDGLGTHVLAYHPYSTSSTPSGLFGRGMLASVDGPFSDDTVSYTYDALKRRVSRMVGSTALGRSISYDYLGRVVGVTYTGPQARSSTIQYVGLTGRPSVVLYPEFGLRTDFLYHNATKDRRLSQIKNTQFGVVLSQFDYPDYDAAGNILTWTRREGTNAPTIYTFGYDFIYQLTSAVLKNSSNATLKSYAWTYDGSGNRTSQTIDGVTKSYALNNLNQITSFDGTSYTYDDNGNLLSHGSRSFTYDAANRIVSWTRPGEIAGSTATTTFQYDGFGRRAVASFNVWGTPSYRRSLFDGVELMEFRDSAFGYQRVTTDRGMQIDYRNNATGYATYFMKDHLGSTREMVINGSGAVARFDYDPYGVRTVSSSLSGIGNNTDVGFQGLLTQPWGITGMGITTGYTGMDFSRTRPYDAKDGRWIGRDPAGEDGGTNLYAAMANNPVNLVDRSGEAWIRPPYTSAIWGNCANDRFIVRGNSGSPLSHNLGNRALGMNNFLNPRLIMTFQCPPGQMLRAWDVEWIDPSRPVAGFDIPRVWQYGNQGGDSNWREPPGYCGGPRWRNRDTIQEYWGPGGRPTGRYNLSLQLESRMLSRADGSVQRLLNNLRPVVDCVPRTGSFPVQPRWENAPE